MTAPSQLSLVKGHGTENDFLLVEDLADELDLRPELVRALCDRRAGLGADGILRVLRRVGEPDFFMDYRNADGSPAEMCGNGIRVFLRYLIEAGLLEQGLVDTGLVEDGGRGSSPVRINTRGGLRTVWTEPDGQITVDLGLPGFPIATPTVTVPGWIAGRPGTAVTMPNPHVVVELAGAGELADLDLAARPRVEPSLPGGQNLEFFHLLGPRHLAMRVHERGSGETRSCGTGIAAAAVVAMRGHGGAGTDDDKDHVAGSFWRVEVPGGTCLVRLGPDGAVLLTGPAVLVGRIDVDPSWLVAVAARGQAEGPSQPENASPPGSGTGTMEQR